MSLLDYRHLSPFKILDLCGKSSFLLKLPSSLSQLHPVFHVSLLELFIDPNNIPDRISEPIVRNIEIPEQSNVQISTILNSQKVGHRYDYFAHWKNTTDTENSWIPFSDIPNSLFHILDQFHRRNPSHPHPPRFLFSTNLSQTHFGDNKKREKIL